MRNNLFSAIIIINSIISSMWAGTEGQIHIESPWFCDGSFTIVRPQGVDIIEIPADKDAYALEAEAFASTVSGSATPWISREDTVGNMRTLDQLRRSAGVPFPE